MPAVTATDCEPDAMLTEVHRQAQDDPIVRMSMDIREGRDNAARRFSLVFAQRISDSGH